MREFIKGYLDDFIAHTQTEDKLLEVLGAFFLICRKNNLKRSAKKCKFFLKQVKW